MYVTEDTTRADPETAAAAVLGRDPRRRDAGLHLRHGRPRDAGGRCGGRRASSRRSSRSAAAASGSTGTATAIATSRSSTRSPRSTPGATRVHGAAIGIGERVGNTPMDMLLVNLVLMGYIERDLSALVEYCEARLGGDRRADSAELPGRRPRRVPHGDRRPRRGGHQGVPQEGSRAGRRGVLRRARRAWSAASRRSKSARCRANRTSSSGSRSAACRSPTRVVDRIFARAKASTAVLEEARSGRCTLSEQPGRPLKYDALTRRHDASADCDAARSGRLISRFSISGSAPAARRRPPAGLRRDLVERVVGACARRGSRDR